MQSICMFKSTVLGDPRILLMGSTAFEESIGTRVSEDEVVEENARIAHSYLKVDNET